MQLPTAAGVANDTESEPTAPKSATSKPANGNKNKKQDKKKDAKPRAGGPGKKDWKKKFGQRDRPATNGKADGSAKPSEVALALKAEESGVVSHKQARLLRRQARKSEKKGGNPNGAAKSSSD